MEKATSSWGQSIAGLALVRPRDRWRAGLGSAWSLGGRAVCPPLVVTRGWETQAGPQRKHSEAEVLEWGGFREAGMDGVQLSTARRATCSMSRTVATSHP